MTCGSCQKPFPLGDIVKFIQHKILVCNKENYSLSYVTSGEACDDNSDDGGPSGPGQPLGVVNSRRPSISAPINSKKSSTPNPIRLVCSPPATSPKITEDEATTSTPKRRGGSSSPSDLKDDVENHLSEDELKPRIKQELDPGSSPDDVKKIRGVDAESNTTNSGRWYILFSSWATSSKVFELPPKPRYQNTRRINEAEMRQSLLRNWSPKLRETKAKLAFEYKLLPSHQPRVDDWPPQPCHFNPSTRLTPFHPRNSPFFYYNQSMYFFRASATVFILFFLFF